MNIACLRRGFPIMALTLLVFAPTTAGAHEPAAPAAKAQGQYLSASPKLSVIARAPDFALRDTGGKDVRLSDYRGRAVLLAFIFTTCSQACPLITHQMALLQGQLKRARQFPEKAGMLSVTVDPMHDTPEVLARYAQQFGADPAGWRFLHDSPDKLSTVLAAYDEWTKRLPKGELDHPARVFLIDPNGNIREVYSLAFFNEKQALLDFQALLGESK